MAVIAVSVLLGIADRAAWQAGPIIEAFDDINTVGGGLYFDRISATDDPDVEIPLADPYNRVDVSISNDWANALSGTNLTNIVNAMFAHFNRVSSPGGWDGYLGLNDERVSDYFNKLYYASTGGQWMLANNVFSEDDNVFGTAEVTAGPTLVFADGINYGNGAVTNPANGTYFAATQLKAQVTSAIGVSNLDLRLSVKDVNDQPTTIDVTIPAGSGVGAEVDIGTSSDRFLDVTDIIFKPAGSTGTVGDEVQILNKKERQVAP